MEQIEVLDPTVVGVMASQKLARRLGDFRGKRIGALWNGRPEEDMVLKAIMRELDKTYGLKSTRLWRKPAVYIAAPQPMIDEIAHSVDAVITGVGT